MAPRHTMGGRPRSRVAATVARRGTIFAALALALVALSFALLDPDSYYWSLSDWSLQSLDFWQAVPRLAAVLTGALALVSLIIRGSAGLHSTLGLWGGWLAAANVVAGIAVVLHSQQFHRGFGFNCVQEACPSLLLHGTANWVAYFVGTSLACVLLMAAHSQVAASRRL